LTLFALTDILLEAADKRRKSFPHNNFSSHTARAARKGRSRFFIEISQMAGLEIRNLSKHFRGGAKAVDGVDLDVADGELLVVLGDSGSGKTTLLRLIAGLEQPTQGTIHLGGRDVTALPPHQRNVAMVFQDLALYSHLRVRDNLAFGLAAEPSTDKKQDQIEQRVLEVAQMLGIEPLLNRYPAELSGGEQQRVALGRAIARRPAVLLLDEPLSSLDTRRRRSLRQEIKNLQRRLGAPTIYVTHDEDDALALADRIAVLQHGRLEQVGLPEAVLSSLNTETLPLMPSLQHA
jgi:multiple sugar transport system ATP-binding protein